MRGVAELVVVTAVAVEDVRMLTNWKLAGAAQKRLTQMKTTARLVRWFGGGGARSGCDLRLIVPCDAASKSTHEPDGPSWSLTSEVEKCVIKTGSW